MKIRSRFSISGAARMLGAIALGVILLGATVARADTQQEHQNIVDLINYAEIIIRGNVLEVTDGFDANNLPYTEVKVEVKETLRGNVSGEYTFRQFGLLKPRVMPNGKTLLAVAPEGFPQWRAGQTIVAFLYTPAQLTGLQTTAGLSQGLLTIENGRLMNELGNAGLFDGVEINDHLLTADEREMLKSQGPVNSGTFMGLVVRAINGQWIENGEMR